MCCFTFSQGVPLTPKNNFAHRKGCLRLLLDHLPWDHLPRGQPPRDHLPCGPSPAHYIGSAPHSGVLVRPLTAYIQRGPDRVPRSCCGGGGDGLPPSHASPGSGDRRGQVFDAVPGGKLRQVELEGVRVGVVGRSTGRRETREGGG